MGQRLVAAVRARERCSPSTPMARVLRPYIALLMAATDVIRRPGWSCRAEACTGRRTVAAVRAMGRSSPSTPMAQVLRPSIRSRQHLDLRVLLARTATELIREADWFYRATPFMRRRGTAALPPMAQCLPSTPMAPGLVPCIVSQHGLVLPLPTATELIPVPVD